MVYRKWVICVCFPVILIMFPSILWRQSISLSHIPLYCTSNFSLPSLFLCLPPLSSPPLSDPSEWRLRIDGRLFQSEQECLYMESYTTASADGVAGTPSECGLLWFVKRGGGGVICLLLCVCVHHHKWEGACVRLCAHARTQKPRCQVCASVWLR